MDLAEKVSAKQLKSDIPEFRVGDTVRVDVKIIEGKKERIQAFEGIVTSRKGGGINETFTVRKISYGVGVNRIFPVHSPKIAKITVVKSGKVRRAKLNFLKDRVSGYRIKERGNKAGK
ncbi:MAG: 50S ribosomal protein L19 [Bacilli bacterium]|nr:50S ribosomal protein L19 [Bacilli bacterium]